MNFDPHSFYRSVEYRNALKLGFADELPLAEYALERSLADGCDHDAEYARFWLIALYVRYNVLEQATLIAAELAEEHDIYPDIALCTGQCVLDYLNNPGLALKIVSRASLGLLDASDSLEVAKWLAYYVKLKGLETSIHRQAKSSTLVGQSLIELSTVLRATESIDARELATTILESRDSGEESIQLLMHTWARLTVGRRFSENEDDELIDAIANEIDMRKASLGESGDD